MTPQINLLEHDKRKRRRARQRCFREAARECTLALAHGAAGVRGTTISMMAVIGEVCMPLLQSPAPLPVPRLMAGVTVAANLAAVAAIACWRARKNSDWLEQETRGRPPPPDARSYTINERRTPDTELLLCRVQRPFAYALGTVAPFAAGIAANALARLAL